ncbi:flagellar hook-length control protein FliK [Shewanella sp. SR43-8]|uniref:flagellar hook-length control protein FliK n=1 Tax=Shewanella sp. SR43-8 TaxID=2760938 RepID=UPI001600EA93|nr:flagellar hook-length control protein FliK [Shewanella sp. SR43-8]MBB1320125.1 flagellar hook-length control protein FliK [Shewanella sp. SR43-8]
MQQMSNILLGNSSKSADLSTKGNMQGVENTSFLSAFNQASESELASRPTPNSAPVSLDAEMDQVDAANDLDISTEENADDHDLPTEENADVELIFAQLNMADALNKRHSSGGNELPHVDTLDIGFDAISLIDPNSSIIDELNSDSQSEMEALLTDAIDLPADSLSTKEALSQLSPEDISSLMAFANSSENDLQALDIKGLSELINDFNLQAPVVDESILAMVSADIDSSDDSPKSILRSEEQNQIDKSIAASVTVPGQTGSAGLNSAVVKLDRTGFLEASSTLASSSAISADPKTILGDSTGIDGNIQSDTDNAKILAKADFSVVLDDSLATKRTSGELSANINSANLGLDAVNDIGDTDTKALQNQSSFTPIHKSDVPQFQLSLKPQGDHGAQMQEMIQRFSPVMKQQLITMVSNGIQQAEIRLDPPELGHLTVKIQIHGDQTQVQFHVAQSQTRDIVEQAMPRLRDMLAQEGLQLTDSQVSQGDGGRDQQGQSGDHAAGDTQLDEISAQEPSLMTNPSRSLHSAIDYYA